MFISLTLSPSFIICGSEQIVSMAGLKYLSKYRGPCQFSRLASRYTVCPRHQRHSIDIGTSFEFM